MKIRKIAAVIAATAVALCGGCSSEKPQKSGIKVITTNFPPYDFVRQISGGEIIPDMLLSGGQDAHSYEPTAKDIVKINEADIFICTGGESDAWVDNITDSLDSNVKIIKMMDFVEPVTVHHHEEDEEEHEHNENEYDEHVWTSPKNAILISEGIANALCEVSPENAQKLGEGMEAYKTELLKLDNEFSETAEKLTKPLIFGDRFPFSYLSRDYGIEYFAAFTGCSSDTEPSAAVMTSLIDKAKETDAKVIYHIEFSTEKVARTIAEAIGADTALMHSCHTLSTKDLETGETYISIMRKNIDAILLSE